MHRRNEKYMDNDRLSQLIGELYRHADQADGWLAFFSLLESDIPTRSTTLMLENTQEKNGDVMLNRHIDESDMQSYIDYYLKRDVWSAELIKRPPKKFHGSQELSDKALLASEFYADYARPADVRHACGAYIEDPSQGRAFRVTLQRSHSHQPFSRDELTSLDAFVPHIQNALAIHKRNIDGEITRMGLEAVGRIVDSAAFLLSPRGELLSHNSMAEALLKRGIALHRGRQLRFNHPQLDRHAAQLFNDLMAFTDNKQRQARRFARIGDSDNGYQMSVEPWLIPSIRPGYQELGALLQLKPNTLRSQLSHQGLRKLFGLTASEASVIQSLADGCSAAAIAQQLGVKESTVRSHIKSSYQKLGVGKQSELLSVVFSSLARL